MRSTKTLILAGIAAILIVGLLGLGCSDNDAPTTTTTTIILEDNGIDALVGTVSTQVNAYLDSAVSVIDAGLQVATFIDIDAGDIGDVFMGGFLPDSTKEEHNWIVSWATDLQAGLGRLTIIDSLTYIVNGALSVSARDATDMWVKHNYNFQTSDTTVTFNNLSQHGSLHIAGIDGTTALINGEFSTVISNKFVSNDSTTWNEWTISMDVNNLAVSRTGAAWDNGCPVSGAVTAVVEYLQAKDTDVPTVTVWEFNMTFTDGAVAVNVSTGNLSASYDLALCTP